jgi:hypothetical protein
MTLAFNFAMVDPKFDHVQDAFQRYVNIIIDDFLRRYPQCFDKQIMTEIQSLSFIDEKLQKLFLYCARHHRL